MLVLPILTHTSERGLILRARQYGGFRLWGDAVISKQKYFSITDWFSFQQLFNCVLCANYVNQSSGRRMSIIKIAKGGAEGQRKNEDGKRRAPTMEASENKALGKRVMASEGWISRLRFGC